MTGPGSPFEVWVVAETFAGRMEASALELVSEAARLAVTRDGRVTAILLDSGPGLAEALSNHGADVVLRVDGMVWDEADLAVPAGVVAELISQNSPSLVLISATAFGSDLAPRLAVRTGAGLVEDCTYLRITSDGVVHGTRTEQDGAAASRIVWREDSPALALVPPGTFRADTSIPRPVRVFDVQCPELPQPAAELLDSSPIDPRELPLEDAAVIVAGGLGMGGKDGFALLADLASAMGGKVGASRRATDLGWAGRDALVGQTGKTVEPAIYVACGISGASQHVLGMKDSGYVVSINSDPYAPIHGVADLAVTADAVALVPLLTAEFQRVEGGSSST